MRKGAALWRLAAACWLACTAGALRSQAVEVNPLNGAADSAAAGLPARLPGFGPHVFGSRPSVEQMTALGAQLFTDPALSASGKQACASCHDPAHAFAPANRLAAQPGGPSGRVPGVRNAPSLMYLQTTVPFTEHFIDDEDGHGEDAGPTGGLTWDGRVNTAHEQARIPLFAAHEMANRSAADIAARLRRSPYADAFRAAFSAPGQDVFDSPDEVLGWLASALEVYQQDPAVFYPFTSKYDAVLRQQASFSARERRGFALFTDPAKGNCASCHPSRIRSDGGLPLFTDSGHIALGLPRNPQLAANHDPRYFDLGLCGPARTDLAADTTLCGRFKAPSLRNVARRGSYFHNGSFHSLREVVEFYVTRDTAPARWYPRKRDGSADRFNDLPQSLRGNVNTEAPFLPLPGNKPRLNRAEIGDLVAFLQTLNDGYRPPAAPPR